MRFESMKGPKKKKKRKKCFVTWKTYFLKNNIVNFSLLLLFCTSKMIVGYF